MNISLQKRLNFEAYYLNIIQLLIKTLVRLLIPFAMSNFFVNKKCVNFKLLNYSRFIYANTIIKKIGLILRNIKANKLNIIEKHHN